MIDLSESGLYMKSSLINQRMGVLQACLVIVLVKQVYDTNEALRAVLFKEMILADSNKEDQERKITKRLFLVDPMFRIQIQNFLILEGPC